MTARPRPDAAHRMAEADSAFHTAIALHREGQGSRADALCAQVLEADPRHFGAYHLRGLIALEGGEVERGIDLIERSLAANPRQPAAHSNIGNALLTRSRPEEALARFDRALLAAPEYVAAWFNRGNALRELRRFDEALASYDRALALEPGHIRACNNRGLVLVELGRLEAALAAFERALALDHRFDAAERNRVAVLIRLGRPLEALECCERAVKRDPADPQALCGRGQAQAALERFEDALASFTSALQIDPKCVDALIKRGQTLQALGRHEAALEDYQQALRLAPGHDHAIGSVLQMRLERCDWNDYAALRVRLEEVLRTGNKVVNPITLLMLDSPELGLTCARTLVEQMYPPTPAEPGEPNPAGASRGESRRIRLAYVSADFCDHPVSHLLVGVLERHERERFEVIGVSLRPSMDRAFERRLRGAFDRFIEVGNCSDREIAAMLRAAGVDIAVDLMGFTLGLRLGIFAQRAAPVQVNYLGYAGTLGAPYIDYVIADWGVIPAGAECWFSEQVVRLPDCYLPNDDRREAGALPGRLEAGLPERGTVFCAFTNAYKLSPPMFEIWMRLLRETQDSVLWLRALHPAARANLQREAQRRGVAADRLVFAPHLAAMSDHLGRQGLADLYLDTLPCNAHSTACDALWAGVPVLTCAGRSFAGRVAASALEAVGLPELITHSLEEYERRAHELARRPEELQALRSRLAERRRGSALFDTTRYTRHLEAAYLRMHERAARGETAASFAVEPSAPYG
jgi:protein O-GlcNAc transferase